MEDTILNNSESNSMQNQGPESGASGEESSDGGAALEPRAKRGRKKIPPCWTGVIDVQAADADEI